MVNLGNIEGFACHDEIAQFENLIDLEASWCRRKIQKIAVMILKQQVDENAFLCTAHAGVIIFFEEIRMMR